MAFLIKGSEPKLSLTVLPFLFMNLLQIAITCDLNKHNVNYDDILSTVPNLTTV